MGSLCSTPIKQENFTTSLSRNDPVVFGNERTQIVVWDFDWSMINECVDYWILRQFGEASETIDRELRKIKSAKVGGRVPSNVLMDHLFRFMFDNFGISAEAMLAQVVHVPVFKENLKLIRLLHASGVSQWIVSDANQLFIERILKHHNVFKYFAEVHTNHGRIEANGCLRVDPYVPYHNCELIQCLNAPNLCKGNVMDMIKNQYSQRAEFCFVGDGSGDFCAGVHLEAHDTLYARTGKSLEKLVEKDLVGDRLLRCKVVFWNDGAELQRKVMSRVTCTRFPIQENNINSAAPAT